MEKVYLLTYKLSENHEHCDEIFHIIKETISISWCKYWESSFLLTSTTSTSEMMDHLKPYLGEDDTVLIIEVKNNMNGWLTSKQWEWIKKHIFSQN